MSYVSKTRQLIYLPLISLFALWGCQSSELGPAESLTTYSKPNIPTPIDVLYYEDEENDKDNGNYYIAKLVMRTDNEGVIRFEDANTSQVFRAYNISAESGIGSPVGTTANSNFDDFVHTNYTEWCGRVHTNRRGKWQFCTGKDCPGGGICIKHCVFVQGVCVP